MLVSRGKIYINPLNSQSYLTWQHLLQLFMVFIFYLKKFFRFFSIEYICLLYSEKKRHNLFKKEYFNCYQTFLSEFPYQVSSVYN